MELSNLASGLLGAVIAVFLGEFIRAIDKRLQIRSERKILVNYLKNIVRPALDRYLTDIDFAVKEIENYPPNNNILTPHLYDVLPMLNSDILRNIQFKNLYLLLKNGDDHVDIINLYHVIDYLKQNMPYDTLENVKIFCEKHFEIKEINNYSDRIIHSKNCITITTAKERSINNVMARKSTLILAMAATDSLINKLSI